MAEIERLRRRWDEHIYVVHRKINETSQSNFWWNFCTMQDLYHLCIIELAVN